MNLNTKLVLAEPWTGKKLIAVFDKYLGESNPGSLTINKKLVTRSRIHGISSTELTIDTFDWWEHDLHEYHSIKVYNGGKPI